MCYCCATNPSIHHCCCHITAMSSPLSHHGVTFMLVTVSSLPLRCHLCCHIVAVLSSPLCCCGAFAVALSQFHRPHCSVTFVVAVVVSPLCLSWFHCCRCGVAFASVVVSSLPLRCRLHIGCSFIVAIMVSPLSLHHRSVIIAVTSLWCLHCHIVVVSSLPLQCRLHHRIVAILLLPSWCRLHVYHSFIIAIAVLPSRRLRFRHCHRGVTFTLVVVLLLPLWCRLHCRIVVVSSSQSYCCGAFTVTSSPFHCRHRGVAFVVALSWFCHCHGVAFIVALSQCRCHGFVVTIVVSSSRRSQFRRCHCGVTFIVASSQCCRHRFVVTVAVLSSRFCHHLVVLLLQSHRCVVVVVVVALLWSLLLRCGRCC